jgi:membrane-associated protease RseP (regulator of RpoE activity)
LEPVRRDPQAAPLPFEFVGGPPEYVWHPPRKFRDRVWVHVVLFLATVLSTTIIGELHYAGFITDFAVRPLTLAGGQLFVRGLWYSATILAILGCHELGHYFACRYYDVDASLPFFLPAPFVQLTGTLGAFIRIREPIPSKRMLFDIGIAGPIAGFVVAVPALFLGLWMSRVVVFPKGVDGLELGEPLLFKLATWLIWGTVPEGYTVNLHPVAFAAWFGLLATALNLFPIGQFDGGHISYAVLGRKSSQVTLVMVLVAALLTYFSLSWLVWTVLAIGMLFLFGRHHPRTFDEDVPLDSVRCRLALFAVVMFILSFTPAPIEPLKLIR